MPRITLDLTDEAAEALSALAARLGVTKAETLRRGLALAAAAAQAKDDGLKIGATDKNGVLTQEWITGD